MTAPDDLIRRGDAERAAISYHPADGSCCHEDPTGHHAAVWACDGIAERIRALPADRVADAAGKLAELLMSDLDESESMGPAAWDEALTAVRAAVAARAKETA